ncbi:helix-turn-helix domain-containing protein [Planomicrobium soli]|uniref:helix-turn-helix domain-containing protein n=1 Tax=Planomicrobium soli TaxID=1176648 RepID=UPI0015E76299|nr:helix-turn-helix domain-containing protein [Planomicrobium soli]
MEENQNSLESLLRGAIERRNYSVRQLADLTSIDKATISRIVNGKRKPTLQHLKKLSATLDLSFNDLVEAIDQDLGSEPSKQKKADKKTFSAAPLANEMDLLQKSVQLHDKSITIDKLSTELETFEKYAETNEGISTIEEGFEAKVKNFGNIGPYIQQLQLWHRKISKREGSKSELAIMAGALLYFILPLDLLHDYVFAVGYLDDCLAIQLAANKLDNRI